jgi:hypothetical protein
MFWAPSKVILALTEKQLIQQGFFENTLVNHMFVHQNFNCGLVHRVPIDQWPFSIRSTPLVDETLCSLWLHRRIFSVPMRLFHV